MRFAFFVFSRIDSSRLPAKAMLKLGEHTVLGSILTRLQAVNGIDTFLLTSDRDVDNCLVDYAESLGVRSYRGSLDNVAGRICGALDTLGVDAFFRVNGDSPFMDVSLYQEAMEALEQTGPDFISNIVTRTYPYGVAVELFRSDVFLKYARNFESAGHQEHATSFFYENLDRFDYQEMINPKDWSKYSLTIDTLEDYLAAQRILSHEPDFLDLKLAAKIERLEELAND